MLAKDLVARLGKLASGLEKAAWQQSPAGTGDSLRQRQLAAC